MVNHENPWFTMDIHGSHGYPIVNHGYDGSGDPNHCEMFTFLKIWNSSPDRRNSPDSAELVSGAAN